MWTLIPSTTAAASTKPGGSGACACTGCAESSSNASAAWVDGCITVPSHHRRSAPNAFGAIGAWRQHLANHGIPAHSETTPGVPTTGRIFQRFLSPPLQLELLHNLAVESDAANGPENGHAPLHGSHHCCRRLVAHLSYQCGRRTAVWSGRAAGSGGRILRIVGRFPPCVEASSAQRNASIPAPAQRPRRAHGTASCAQRASTFGAPACPAAGSAAF